MNDLTVLKALREKTGASLQACKNALSETGGDEAAALDVLRKKGEAKTADRLERDTREGVVASAVGVGKGVIVKLLCETDFVAKNDDFVQAAETIAQHYLNEGASYDPSSIIQELNLKMGEKVAIGEARFLEAAVLDSYIHSNRKVGSLVGLAGGSSELARDLAMHVTAMNPMVLSPEEVSKETLDHEREIWNEQLAQEGKPQAILDKILEGKERKFREEHSLLKQPFVKNPDQSIETLLNGIAVQGFVRLGN